MKFNFEKNDLLNEIAICGEIIATKNATSVLSSVYLIAEKDQLIIKATDTKISFKTAIKCDVVEEGETTCLCEKLSGILASLDDGICEFSTSEKNGLTVATIKHLSKKLKYNLKCLSTDLYPDVVTSTMDNGYFEIPGKDFKEMITQTKFAVSVDETRYFLTGIYFEKKDGRLNCVSTDGRRLAFDSKEIDTPDFNAVIIPPKVLGIVLKQVTGTVKIAVVDKLIMFKVNNYEFSSILIDGKFPDYTRVIPKNNDKSVTFEKSDLVNAIKKNLVLVDKKAGRIYLLLNKGAAKLYTPESELGNVEIEIPCAYSGDEILFALNIQYLSDAVNTLDSDKIIMEFTAEMKAVIFKGENNPDCIDVIMPMSKE